MTLTEIFVLLGVHWIADFVLQTHYQAINKSKEWKPLLSHTLNYSLCMWLFAFFITRNVYAAFTFWFITFVCHTITDYYTSRLNSRLWAKGDTHNFFVSVGFDQYLHYIQLFLTYQLIK